MNLPIGDKTPLNFSIETIPLKEKAKRIIRQYFYPYIVRKESIKTENQFPSIKDIGFDELFLGQRGNDYEAHRRRINRFKSIKDTTVLIVGIGTGKDLESWLKFKPKKIIAVDYFEYGTAWKIRKEYYQKRYDTSIEFLQADIINLQLIGDESIDIIGSDAVLEHINPMREALHELYRILKKDGLLYSNFGPLWYSWGGDHISGADDFINGYNHIRLPKDEYNKYLENFGDFEHSEHDGRTWILNNLFSYLKPQEYLTQLENAKFQKLYVSSIIDPKAIRYKNEFPDIFSHLSRQYGEENLCISGMTILYVKK